ncbi:hypothetical protein [Effusibacillus dendaii]|nr:hypothetical protein [Effusibacillus dendaii]
MDLIATYGIGITTACPAEEGGFLFLLEPQAIDRNWPLKQRM